MKINSKCLNRLTVIGLPMNVDVMSTSGKNLGQAIIETDGSVIFKKIKYLHPSHLRQEVIAKNTATYKHLVYSSTNPNAKSQFYGQTLSQLGVQP